MKWLGPKHTLGDIASKGCHVSEEIRRHWETRGEQLGMILRGADAGSYSPG